MTDTPESGLRDCDVIVIGAGLGGGVISRALTEAGLRVTLLEKGHAGHRNEETRLDDSVTDPVARAVRGFWPDPAEVEIDGRALRQFLPLGSGVGGSSVFYAATLERPARHDIEDSPDRPHPAGGWPMDWDTLAPWFDRAEAQFLVAGTPDPLDDRPAPALRPPPVPMGEGDRGFMDLLERNGLHPYHLHSALAHVEGCLSCLGRKCPRRCKMDGRSAGVEPAMATGRLRLETRAEVTAITLEDGRAGAVHYRQDGRDHVLRAGHVVLAAGALSSPRILLASRGEGHPQGIGNAHDQVGRHLMCHINDMFVVWPPRRAAFKGASKSVGFRDFYFAEGQRLGMVQAMGVEAGYGEILHFIRYRLSEKGLTGRLWQEAARLPALFAARLVGQAKLFSVVLEDMPDPENRLLFDPDAPQRIRLRYASTSETELRRKLMRRKILQGFKGRRLMFLADRAWPNLGHSCGTLRMGRDPRHSVTDGAGRIHGIGNLWVADASVFPSSMGVNPSLTIAALALRQAQAIRDAIEGER